MSPRKKTSHHSKIFIGMIVGAAAGLIVQAAGADKSTIDNIVSYVKPIGDVFLRMVFMMVIPLIVSGLAIGVADLGDIRRIGRIGVRALVFSLFITGISVFIGIAMAEIFQPGASLAESDRAMLIERYSASSEAIQKTGQALQSTNVLQTLVNIIPKNPIEDMARAFEPGYTGGGVLAIMFFALILGVSLALSNKERTRTFWNFLEGLYEVVMKAISLAMKLAPIGVAALLFTLTATLGWAIFEVLLKYVLVVLAALALHQFGTYSLVLKLFCRMSPIDFFRKIREVMLTAFSTSSSNVTLPTAIRVAQEDLKLPREISNFVLTIGSTANQNGTALYEGITVLFLAQCFGIHLDISQQIFIVFVAVLSGIGTAGVPGGSLPIVMLILISIGIPGEAIAIIYGVDRILDMSRTTLNVTGDIVAAVFVSQQEAKRGLAT
jgi:dicarboxylate/amino acid:cation (Na+ or H+) symporter, DAACS family